MIPAISSQVFLPQPLTPALLDALHAGVVKAIVLEAARWHLDVGDRAQVRELRQWFDAHAVAAWLGAPVFAEREFSRPRLAMGPTLDLLDLDRARRIAAMDESKRALELGDELPLAGVLLTLGTPATRWSEATLDHALAAVEHLRAFSAPLGFGLTLVSGPGEFATPAHLAEVLQVGHFRGCAVALDLLLAHAAKGGLPAAIEQVQERGAVVGAVRIADAFRDQPGVRTYPPAGPPDQAGRERVLDWPAACATLQTLPAEALAILAVPDTAAGSAEEVSERARQVCGYAVQLAEQRAQAAEQQAARG